MKKQQKNEEEAVTPVKEKKAKRVRVKAHEINLIKAARYAKESEKKEHRKGKPSAFAFALVILVILGAGVWYTMAYLEKADLEAENEDLEWEISDLQDDYDTAKQLSYKQSYVTSLKSATQAEIQAAGIGEAQLEYYDSSFFTRLRRYIPSDVTIVSISFDSETLSLSLTASKNTQPAEIVNELREDEMFTDIEYSGFSSDGESGQTSFSITCTVAKTSETGEAE